RSGRGSARGPLPRYPGQGLAALFLWHTSRKGVNALSMVSKRSKRLRRQGHPPCPHCDQPEISLLRLVLIGEILRAEEPLLVRLADVVQQSSQRHHAEEPTTPPVRRRQGTVPALQRPETDRE